MAQVVQLGHRRQHDAGEAGVGAAFDLGHPGHRQARGVDAVDAAGMQQVADLHVGIAGHEAQLHCHAAIGAAKGRAALLAAGVEHGNSRVAVDQQRDHGAQRVDLDDLAEHTGLVDHRCAGHHALGGAAVDEDLA